jgi:DNA repair exonuclease SbcCD ATPase subunit
MKSSNSQFLKSIKGTFFNTLNTNEDLPQGTYNKTKEKVSMLEFELERNRDIIIKLRAELASKNKEISLLKVNKNRKSEEYEKSMRVIEEILKQCDQSTTAGFNAIENNLLNSDVNPSKKNKNTNLPQIGDMLHFSSQHKKIMKEMVYVYMLKNQINNLNEELGKKNEKINQLKKNQNSTNFTKLQNNFLKNFNELTMVKKENEFMKTKIEDVHHLLMAEKEDNFNLKNKLIEFQDQYRFYKDTTEKKTNALETMLAKLRDRERDCKIFHVRKGSSVSAKRPIIREKKKASIEVQEKKENQNDEGNNKINEELKKMSKTMTELRNSQNNKDSVIKLLTKDKQNLNGRISILENEKNKLLLNIESLNKQIKEGNTTIKI